VLPPKALAFGETSPLFSKKKAAGIKKTRL
jgi:hypothetical protein